MKNVLMAWIGFADKHAARENGARGLGPIAQVVSARRFEQICLLSDLSEQETCAYRDWLGGRTGAGITVYREKLASAVDFSQIYEAAVRTVTDVRSKFGRDLRLVFHISPGTSSMAAIWIVLSKTRFPAELVQSSLDYGVQTVVFPFDLSAEYLQKKDETLEKLAVGLPVNAAAFESIIYRSNLMKEVVLKARRFAPRSIPVLLEGESGTGKELFARAIHGSSPRRDQPFVAINCGAMAKNLIESELFGHEKGAFTGATARKKGCFETADNGTLFLDEIGELPLAVQVHLLRTLQEKEVRRVGGTDAIKVDVRIIAATNRNLMDEVARGRFREDLFYRIAVLGIDLPPLRDRTGDIGLLTDHFLERANQEAGAEDPAFQDKQISVSARNILLRHPWPGNVRELENTITRAVILEPGSRLTEAGVRDALHPAPSHMRADGIMNQPLSRGIDLQKILGQVAVHYLEKAMEHAGGNKTKAAQLLGLSNYQTLTNWLKKYKLE